VSEWRRGRIAVGSPWNRRGIAVDRSIRLAVPSSPYPDRTTRIAVSRGQMTRGKLPIRASTVVAIIGVATAPTHFT
jgi:hypothetical protein